MEANLRKAKVFDSHLAYWIVAINKNEEYELPSSCFALLSFMTGLQITYENSRWAIRRCCPYVLAQYPQMEMVFGPKASWRDNPEKYFQQYYDPYIGHQIPIFSNKDTLTDGRLIARPWTFIPRSLFLHEGIHDDSRNELKKIGFTIFEEDLPGDQWRHYYKTVFPEGMTIEFLAIHPNSRFIRNDKNHLRAEIYDPSTDIPRVRLLTRYYVVPKEDAERNVYALVKDRINRIYVLYRSDKFRWSLAGKEVEATKQATDWLNEHRPQWKDPLQYWDE